MFVVINHRLHSSSNSQVNCNNTKCTEITPRFTSNHIEHRGGFENKNLLSSINNILDNRLHTNTAQEYGNSQYKWKIQSIITHRLIVSITSFQ